RLHPTQAGEDGRPRRRSGGGGGQRRSARGARTGHPPYRPARHVLWLSPSGSHPVALTPRLSLRRVRPRPHAASLPSHGVVLPVRLPDRRSRWGFSRTEGGLGGVVCSWKLNYISAVCGIEEETPHA